MINPFIEVALSNVAHDTGYQTVKDLFLDNPLVQNILSQEGIDETQLDLNHIKKNMFRGESRFAVTIPYINEEENTQSLLIAYISKVDENDITFKNMTLSYNEANETTELSFANLDGSNQVTGVFDEDFQLIDMTEVSGDIAIQQTLQECLQNAWGNLPWYIQAACGGSCGACFALNPIACTVCAGCLAGTGIRCV